MPHCAVAYCKNNSRRVYKRNAGVSFHVFPKDPKLKQKWILAATSRHDWTPTQYSSVCSVHFKEDDFIATKSKRRLTETAYPTLRLLRNRGDELGVVSKHTNVVDNDNIVDSKPTHERDKEPDDIKTEDTGNNLVMCRVCLRRAPAGTMCVLSTHLEAHYQLLIGTQVPLAARLPPRLCAQCAVRVRQSARLRRAALEAHALLTSALATGDVTVSTLNIKTSQVEHKLYSPLITEVFNLVNIEPQSLNKTRNQRLSSLKDAESVFVVVEPLKVSEHVGNVNNKDAIATKSDYNSRKPQRNVKSRKKTFVPDKTKLNNQNNRNNDVNTQNILREDAKECCNVRKNDNDSGDSSDALLKEEIYNEANNETALVSPQFVPVDTEQQSQAVGGGTFTLNIGDTALTEVKPKVESLQILSSEDSKSSSDEDWSDNNDVINDVIDTVDDWIDPVYDVIDTVEENIVTGIKRETASMVEEPADVIKSDQFGFVIGRDVVTNQLVRRKRTTTTFFHKSVGGGEVKREEAQAWLQYFTVRELSIEEELQALESRRQAARSEHYTCHVCHKSFKQQNHHTSHAQRHTSLAGPVECRACLLRCRSSKALVRHFICHMYRFSCRRCAFSTQQISAAQTHADAHAGRTHDCPYCHKQLPDQKARSNHIRRSHQTEHVCTRCGGSFASAAGLNHHIGRRHRHGPQVPPTGPICSDCPLQFESEAALSRHVYMSHRVRGPNGRRLERVYKEFHCDQCGSVLLGRVEYRQHMSETHNITIAPDQSRSDRAKPRNQSFMCDQCARIFRTKVQLEGHMWRHTGQKRYTCDHCGKSCTEKTSLALHIKTKHAGGAGASHACGVCGVRMRYLGNLKRHLRTHSGEKPFTCTLCGKAMTTRVGLTTHIAHVHERVPWPKRTRERKPRRGLGNENTEDVDTAQMNLVGNASEE